jgi:hypothetical protein
MSRNPETGNTSGADRAAEMERYRVKADARGCRWCSVAGRWTRRVLPVGSPRDMECLKCGAFYTSTSTFSLVGNTQAARRVFNRRAIAWPFVPQSYHGHWAIVVMVRPLIPHKNSIIEIACSVNSPEQAVFTKSITDALPTCAGCLHVYESIAKQFGDHRETLKANWGTPGWSLEFDSAYIRTAIEYY